MTLWVKIPNKPNVRTMVACCRSLVKKLEEIDPNTAVTGIRINGKERRLEIDVDGGVQDQDGVI